MDVAGGSWTLQAQPKYRRAWQQGLQQSLSGNTQRVETETGEEERADVGGGKLTATAVGAEKGAMCSIPHIIMQRAARTELAEARADLAEEESFIHSLAHSLTHSFTG